MVVYQRLSRCTGCLMNLATVLLLIGAWILMRKRRGLGREQWDAGVEPGVRARSTIIRTPSRHWVVPCVVIPPPNWLSGRFESNPDWPLEFFRWWRLKRPSSDVRCTFYELCKVAGCRRRYRPHVQTMHSNGNCRRQSFNEPTESAV